MKKIIIGIVLIFLTIIPGIGLNSSHCETSYISLYGYKIVEKNNYNNLFNKILRDEHMKTLSEEEKIIFLKKRKEFEKNNYCKTEGFFELLGID